MRRLMLMLLLLLFAAPAVAADEGLAGAWNGAWVKNGDALPVTLRFARSGDGWNATFDSDALQVSAIPLSGVSRTGNAVRFEARGDAGTTVFTGKIDADVLWGEFDEAGVKGSFRFVRDPHTPPPATTRDVTFVNGATRLAGTLVLPREPGPRPAILFLQGSGAEGRWANRWLAERFAEAGFVALVFDKRGVGGSGGDWRGAGFEVLAEDGAAGVRLLRGLPEVDPKRVGVYGHSQGGSVAPLVDANVGGLAFVIASAAPGLKPAEVERFSVGASIGLGQLPAKEQADAKAYIDAVVGVAYLGRPRAELDALAERFKGRSWFFAPPPPDNPYWTLSRAIADHDPAKAWARVKAPVLLLYGAHDERVPVDPSLHAIRAALSLSGNRRVTTKLYPDADHTLTIVEPPSPGWPKHVPNYARMLTAWAAEIR